MGSFRLSHPDGREATGAGCLLAVAAGLVTFVGLGAGLWALSSGPIQLPSWIDPAWLSKDRPVLKYLVIALMSAPGVILFWLGSRWLKRRGVEVWKAPGAGPAADHASGNNGSAPSGRR